MNPSNVCMQVSWVTGFILTVLTFESFNPQVQRIHVQSQAGLGEASEFARLAVEISYFQMNTFDVCLQFFLCISFKITTITRMILYL